MNLLGCDQCNPYAWDFQMVNGRTYCRHCGRMISDGSELLVVSSKQVSAPPRRPNNSFEKGYRVDERGLPYLDRNGNPVRMKESFDPRKYGQQIILIGSN